jgi:hypothetical protein
VSCAPWLATGRHFLLLADDMDLATARQHIQSCLERMHALYTKPVFDEWAILALGAKHGGVLAYSGPRVENFQRELAEDVEPLRALVADRQLGVGDFEFTSEGVGKRHDALLKVGAASYLVCNHTGKSMTDIRTDARWLKAQAVFFELSEKFRADPLAG